jgi:hypothetical protein
MDRELIRKELAMYGMLVDDDGTCTVFVDGKKTKVPVDDQIKKIEDSIRSHASLAKELWNELKQLFHNKPIAIVAGNDATKRMFTEAIKHLNRVLLEMRMDRSAVKQQLQRDIDTFPEGYMRKVVDYKLSIDWVHHLMLSDKYRISLLKALRKAGESPKEVKAILGPWGGLDLPMQERVWEYKDEGESLKGHEQEKQKQERYQLPDTYNDPYEFEEGFYYRELRNEPYAWGDEDSNPYPHRDLLWDS